MIKMRETAMPTLKAFAENFTAVRMGIIEMVPDPRLKTLAQQADAKAAAAAQQAQQAQPTVQQPQPVPAAGTEAVAAPDEEETEEQEEPSKPTGPAPATLEGIDRETLEYANGSL